MGRLFDELRERGFVQQCTDERVVAELLDGPPISFYAGFDPTADSLHVGNLTTIMLCAHLQRAGHRAIIVMGGATAMVGDPSGRTETRQMLSPEQINANIAAIRENFRGFLQLDDPEHGVMVNNAEWLADLNYLQFLREIGSQFSVNRMLSYEAYKQRMQSGLSFLEFNYQLLQAYDFLTLYRRYGCVLQVGGDDQWGNICAGVDLIRRMESVEAYGLTNPLITTASGAKMGKTAAGAVWLSPAKLKPYDYYQYWVNCDDRDVGRFLRLFTFLEVEQIKQLESLPGEQIRTAKHRLAYEATLLRHGRTAADEARQAAEALFGTGGDIQQVPATALPRERLRQGLLLIDALQLCGLASSGGNARRLINQGGAYVNGKRITSTAYRLTVDDLQQGQVLLRAGKKKYRRLVVND